MKSEEIIATILLIFILICIGATIYQFYGNVKIIHIEDLE